MSLPHALLTALVEHPCSGSELAGRFDRSIGYFWHATHQQIYRELARLEAAGWIESLPAESGRGRKRAYRVLPAGRRELERWLASESAPQPLRDEMMVRLRAEAALGTHLLVPELTRRLALHREKLAIYRAIETRALAALQAATEAPPPAGAATRPATPAPIKPLDRTRALQMLVLDAGIRHERYWIELSEKALALLHEPGAGPSAASPPA